MTPEGLHAVAADGVRLSLRRYGAGGRPVLLTHAMMVSGALFERRGEGIAPWLAERGFDAFVLDWRGHGRSCPPEPRTGRWTFDDLVRLDLPAALAAVREATGARADEIAYLGHSLGGLVATAHASAIDPAPFGRAVYLTVNSWRMREAAGPREWARRTAAMTTYRALARLLGYAPIRRVGMGTDDEPWTYVRQLTDWYFRSRWTSADGAVDYAAGLGRVRFPILAVVGAGDPLCTPRDAEGFLATLANAPRRTRVVGRARGDGADPDHFGVLTDPRLRPVWEEIAAALAGGV